jgi:hypothetical protein
MDIIASHQHGLFEILEAEADGLAGRPRDSAQRAVVYHHLADMLAMNHAFALLAARAALGIEPAVEAMRRAARRSWWRMSGIERAAQVERVERFAGTLRALDARRCAGALLAYRLVATPGLSGEAQRRLEPEMVAAFGACRAARGAVVREERRALFVAHQDWAEALVGAELDAAIDALDWRCGARPLRRAVGLVRIALAAYERAETRGLAQVEREVRSDKSLPASFSTNPAQAFYAIQRHLAERRRKSAAEGGDALPADEAVRFAA